MNSQSDQDDDHSKADLRKNLRAPLIVQKIHIDADRPVFFGYSKNISRSGMFIATTNPIGLGTQLNLQIPLPAPINTTVSCCCEVVWKRPLGKRLPFEPGMGLKFLDMPSEIADQLESWINEQTDAF